MVIVSVGALGSHLALFGRSWDAKLVLAEFDGVEQKNAAPSSTPGWAWDATRPRFEGWPECAVRDGRRETLTEPIQ